jgi:hypothetical protein
VAIERPVGYVVGMTRRRLILAACVAVVALRAAWWLFDHEPSPTEQRLIGTWRLRTEIVGETGELVFQPDFSWRCSRFRPPLGLERGSGQWSIQGKAIVFDGENRRAWRMLRPLLRQLGGYVAPVIATTPESIAADEVVFVLADGAREVWTRDRGD